jgi:hypothetical protein
MVGDRLYDLIVTRSVIVQPGTLATVVSATYGSHGQFLEQTCRTLRELTHQKKVWVEFLRLSCKENGIFFPSYNTEDTDLPALQRAALRPHQWKQLLAKHHAGVDSGKMNTETLTAISTRTFPQLTPDAIYYLIPGGRFLVSAVRGLGAISLWDLGCFDRPCSPIRLATSDLDDTSPYSSPYYTRTINVAPLEGDDGLVVAVLATGRDALFDGAYVYV